MSLILSIFKYLTFWFGLHELLCRVIKIPAHIQKNEDSQKRKQDFYRMISDYVALVHAPLTCFFAARLLLRDPKVFNENHGPDYTWNMVVSIQMRV